MRPFPQGRGEAGWEGGGGGFAVLHSMPPRSSSLRTQIWNIVLPLPPPQHPPRPNIHWTHQRRITGNACAAAARETSNDGRVTPATADKDCRGASHFMRGRTPRRQQVGCVRSRALAVSVPAPKPQGSTLHNCRRVRAAAGHHCGQAPSQRLPRHLRRDQPVSTRPHRTSPTTRPCPAFS